MRKAVYEGKLVSVSPNRDFRSQLELPEPLVALHAKKPGPVLDLLARIADGGNTADGLRAVCYALELAGGPGCGEMVASFTARALDKFDVLDKDWECTPREHWLKVLKRKREE